MNNYSEKEKNFIIKAFIESQQLNYQDDLHRTKIREINDDDELDDVKGYYIQIESDQEDEQTLFRCFYIYKMAKIEFKNYIKKEILFRSRYMENSLLYEFGNYGIDNRFSFEKISINKIVNHIWKNNGYDFFSNPSENLYIFKNLNFVFSPVLDYTGYESQF